MAELGQAEIDAIKAAIAAGVKKVGYGDRVIEYQPLEDMLLALGIIQAEVAAQASAAEGKTSSTFASFRRD